jgi:DNA polymerase elongation subunit (family B)
LLRAAEITRDMGYKIIHGIVDSLYVKNTKGVPEAEFREDCEDICRKIEESTKIPIVVEGIYNVIVFMPSRANPRIPTLNHYWGIKTDGEIKYRGIDIRRRDTPKIVKDAQKAMIDVFLEAKTVKQFLAKVPEAKKVLYHYIDKIDSGNVSAEELTVTIQVSRKPSQYKVKSYQAVAAFQKERAGVPVSTGQKVKYIITNAEADPDKAYQKVILTELYDPKRHFYDKEKYIELLQRAFKNIFPFDFDGLDSEIKTRYEKKRNQKSLLNFV